MDASQAVAPFLQYPFLELGRIVCGVLMLGVASYTDFRSRKVPDDIWMVASVVAFIFIAGEILLSGVSLLYLLVLVPIVALLLDVLDYYEILEKRIGRDLFWPAMAAGLAATVALLALIPWDARLLSLLMVPGFILLAYLFYATRLLHGGGDAKAFVAIAMLHPLWPSFMALPLVQPTSRIAVAAPYGFVFFVLFYASLASVLYFTPRNLLRNSRDPEAKAPFSTRALGHRMKVADAKNAYVWPMEVVRDGKVVRRTRPGDDDPKEEFEKLEKAGVKVAWVTPKIPFMVPLAVGYVVAVVLGNAILLMF